MSTEEPLNKASSTSTQDFTCDNPHTMLVYRRGGQLCVELLDFK